jgi:hypothetical protein
MVMAIGQKKWQNDLYNFVCFVSREVEQLTQNFKIKGLNPANGPRNWKDLDLVTYKKNIWSALAQCMSN